MIVLLILAAFIGFSPNVQAETKFEYPELLVSPLASETLALESRRESQSRWTQHLPSQIPALINLFTGLRMMGEEANPKDFEDFSGGVDTKSLDEKTQEIQGSGLLAAVVSGGWLGTTMFMSFNYSPYRSEYRTIRKMKSDSKRLQLIKERRAEEVLEDAAYTGRKLKYIGTSLNFAMAAVLLGSTKDKQTEVQAGSALVASLLPLIFDYDWVDTYNKHKEYKKKIYTPLVEVKTNPQWNGSIRPSLSLTWQF